MENQVAVETVEVTPVAVEEVTPVEAPVVVEDTQAEDTPVVDSEETKVEKVAIPVATAIESVQGESVETVKFVNVDEKALPQVSLIVADVDKIESFTMGSVELVKIQSSIGNDAVLAKHGIDATDVDAVILSMDYGTTYIKPRRTKKQLGQSSAKSNMNKTEKFAKLDLTQPADADEFFYIFGVRGSDENADENKYTLTNNVKAVRLIKKLDGVYADSNKSGYHKTNTKIPTDSPLRVGRVNAFYIRWADLHAKLDSICATNEYKISQAKATIANTNLDSSIIDMAQKDLDLANKNVCLTGAQGIRAVAEILTVVYGEDVIQRLYGLDVSTDDGLAQLVATKEETVKDETVKVAVHKPLFIESEMNLFAKIGKELEIREIDGVKVVFDTKPEKEIERKRLADEKRIEKEKKEKQREEDKKNEAQASLDDGNVAIDLNVDGLEPLDNVISTDGTVVAPQPVSIETN